MPFSLPFGPSTSSGQAGSRRTAARRFPFYLYFVSSLCERRNEIQKEDKVPLRKTTPVRPRNSCYTEITSPPRITNVTRSSARISTNGSPSITRRSASLPGSIVPS